MIFPYSPHLSVPAGASDFGNASFVNISAKSLGDWPMINAHGASLVLIELKA
jgi:hypothetical protein